jgi:hypothetical protein
MTRRCSDFDPFVMHCAAEVIRLSARLRWRERISFSVDRMDGYGFETEAARKICDAAVKEWKTDVSPESAP